MHKFCEEDSNRVYILQKGLVVAHLHLEPRRCSKTAFKSIEGVCVEPLIMALPKGRIEEELLPLLRKAGIIPEAAFFDEKSRLLRFKTNRKNIDVIRVRSFDVATFVAFGTAAFAVAGSDVIAEFDSDDIYAPLDLKIGACRLSVATRADAEVDPEFSALSHIRIATKYPKVTKAFFAERSIQAECIKLNGAMELAPMIGLCDYIADLVSTGNTLKSNGLKEICTMRLVSSYLITNRTLFKTRHDEIMDIITELKGVIDGAAA